MSQPPQPSDEVGFRRTFQKETTTGHSSRLVSLSTAILTYFVGFALKGKNKQSTSFANMSTDMHD